METYCPNAPFSLAVHGGAGPGSGDASIFTPGLTAALGAGRDILVAGGGALDAVTAAVVSLEEDPAFNAGRGAALNTNGQAELDACVMDGATGAAGAVIGARFARNPVLAARAVAQRTVHVLLTDPPRDVLDAWGVETADPAWFITERRLRQLHTRAGDTTSIQAEASPSPAGAPGAAAPASKPGPFGVRGHGTVGAVARDVHGNVAVATSTGGVTGQMPGRVGDSPIPGAGTWADARVAISCTGIGEYFLRAALAHDVAARVALLQCSLPDAVPAAFTPGIQERGGAGGLIAVGGDGTVVLAWNTPAMLRGYLGPDATPIVAVE